MGSHTFFDLWRSLQFVENELLVFAAFWLAVGLIDELAVDIVWAVLRLTGHARTPRLPDGFGDAALRGPAAVLIPAWQESGVIQTTLRHALAAWPQAELRIYVGCYANDPATLAAAMRGAGRDSRVRLVLLGAAGPTTKADCLNRLYQALAEDERRAGAPFRSVLLHDAEDMVHPAALQAIDAALDHADVVQLPVRPELPAGPRFVAGHYADEFAETHTKTLVVRSIIGAAIPLAGVGCGIARPVLERLAQHRRRQGDNGPFAAECLTEDYELGLLLSREGRGGRFLRLRDARGDLVATRAYFPDRLGPAVRQKARWIHGIAFQGWERLGWSARPVELWMILRDRRGPLTALVLFAAYALLVVEALLGVGRLIGEVGDYPVTRATTLLIGLTTLGFIWRAGWRALFVAREYGWREGVMSVARIPVANIVAIMAGRRALATYLRDLRGHPLYWDKTAHHDHPASVPVSAGDVRAARA